MVRKMADVGNLDVNYKMGDTVLGTTIKENNLGVTSANMKVSEQCGIAASNGNQMLGLIGRNITNKEKEPSVPKMIPELRLWLCRTP